MRVLRLRIRHRNLADFLRLRIDAADVRGEITRVPDGAVVGDDQIMGAGAFVEVDASEVAGFRIEHRDVVATLADEPDVSVRPDIRITRTRVLPRHVPFADGGLRRRRLVGCDGGAEQ